MSDEVMGDVSSVDSVSQSPQTLEQSANPAATTTQSAEDVKIGTWEDLKEKNPKLYNMMLKSILTNMLRQIGRHQEKMHELVQSYQNQ